MYCKILEVIFLIPSQMLKGTLEGCVLKVISDNETYGYEISQKLLEHGFEGCLLYTSDAADDTCCV